MGPPPLLNESEEKVLVKWANDCSRKEIPQRKIGVPLTVHNFCQPHETLFKDTLSGNGWF
jgi:hypothetical protein